jgi:salicylate hydroxylase
MPNRRPLRIAIIGAGPGGLVLAQLLRDDRDFEVTVYERGALEMKDGPSLTGYRILMTPDLLDSLRKQLPGDVQVLLDKAIGLSQPNGNRLGFMDTMCKMICRIDLPLMRSTRSVSRWKLREALLSGASSGDLRVEFGRVFDSYKMDGCKGIKISFADGESVHCDLLVGADGAGSRVRKQLIPNSSRSSTGVTTIYFKAPFTPETEAMIPWASGIMVKVCKHGVSNPLTFSS